MLLGQESDNEYELKGTYFRESPKLTCTDFNEYSIKFYTDNKFEFKGYTYLDGIVGKGNYYIKDSILTCIFSGSSICSVEDKSILEVVEDSNGKPEIYVESFEEPLIAAQILIKYHPRIIDTLFTNFDGVAIIPEKDNFEIEVNAIGLESINVYIHGTLSKDIKVDLKRNCGSRVVVKGVRKDFNIKKFKGLDIDLIEINTLENSLIVK